MSKKALLARMAPRFDTMTAAERALDAVIDGITDEVSGGGTVAIQGFGTFKQKRKSARKGRNTHTGESIDIAGKTVLFFDTKVTF
jgi:DNA-binding protein HU-beta